MTFSLKFVSFDLFQVTQSSFFFQFLLREPRLSLWKSRFFVEQGCTDMKVHAMHMTSSWCSCGRSDYHKNGSFLRSRLYGQAQAAMSYKYLRVRHSSAGVPLLTYDVSMMWHEMSLRWRNSLSMSRAQKCWVVLAAAGCQPFAELPDLILRSSQKVT